MSISDKPKVNTKVRTVNADHVFTFCNYAILSIILLVVLFPILYIVSASFSSGKAVSTGQVFLFPVDFNLRGYTAVFKNPFIISGFLNSFFYMIAGTLIGVALTILTAFPLSIQELPFRRGLSFIFTFTMLFAGGLIPTYLLIRNLNMIDTVWAIIIPGALNINNMLVMKRYFTSNLSRELFEAARIDGCSLGRYLIRIVLPLSGAIIAVITLYYAVAHWNSWFSAMVYLNSREKFPLQLILRDILVMSTVDSSMMDHVAIAEQQEMAELIKYAVIVVASVPMLVIYPFVQKHFISGVMAGAVKG